MLHPEAFWLQVSNLETFFFTQILYKLPRMNDKESLMYLKVMI